MAGRPTDRAQAGFTLAELLVAMTLLAFLSVALFGGLRFGARSWDAVVRDSDDRDRIALAQSFLRDRLGQVSLPGRWRGRDSYADTLLEGAPDRVAFSAPWLSSLALGGLYRFTLWYEPGIEPGDGRLMLAWQPADADPDSLDDLGDLAGERVLLDGVAEFGLSYLGIPEDAQELEWHDRWDEGPSPPDLVQIELVFADPGRFWPNFAVAIRY